VNNSHHYVVVSDNGHDVWCCSIYSESVHLLDHWKYISCNVSFNSL